MNYVEALEAEVNVGSPIYLDSAGKALEVGDRVHVSVEQAEGSHWDEEKEEQVGARPFDFGTVDALNEDGTVTVWWDLSGCFCNAPEGGPRENPSHVTKANEDVERFAGVVLDNSQHIHHVLGF